MGRIGGGGDLLLSEAELEAPLAQVRGDRIGLTKLADPRVFVTGVAIRAASAGTAGRRPLSRPSDGALRIAFRGRTELIKSDKFRLGSGRAGQPSSPRRDGASWPAARGRSRGCASILTLKSGNRCWAICLSARGISRVFFSRPWSRTKRLPERWHRRRYLVFANRTRSSRRPRSICEVTGNSAGGAPARRLLRCSSTNSSIFATAAGFVTSRPSSQSLTGSRPWESRQYRACVRPGWAGRDMILSSVGGQAEAGQCLPRPERCRPRFREPGDPEPRRERRFSEGGTKKTFSQMRAVNGSTISAGTRSSSRTSTVGRLADWSYPQELFHVAHYFAWAERFRRQTQVIELPVARRANRGSRASFCARSTSVRRVPAPTARSRQDPRCYRTGSW